MHTSFKTLVMVCAAFGANAFAQSLSVTNKADGKVWVEASAPSDNPHRLQTSANLHLWSDIKSDVTELYSVELTNNWVARKYFRLVPAGEEAPPIRIVIAGDSMSSDCCGWGGGMYGYFKPNATVVNYAVPWTSTEVFLQSAEYEKMLLIKPNYVLIQFGWFDGSSDPDRKTTPAEFAANLKTLVNVIRGFNGVPILLTLHAARTWDSSGNLLPSDHPYNAITRQVAAEVNTPLLDLYQQSSDLLKKLGKSGSDFMHFAPFGPDDVMHLSAPGGVYVSQVVVNGLPDALGPYLTGNLEHPPVP